MINFIKLSSNISNIRQYTENLSTWSHIAVGMMWRRDVGQCQINAVYFSVDIISVRQRRNNAVIFNVEFHCVDQCRNKVVNTTIFKKLKRAKYIFELQKKKMAHLINNTCFWWWSIKKKEKYGTYNVKMNVGKYNAWYMKRIWK